MKISLIVSLILHAILFVFIIIDWQKPKETSKPLIQVDFVRVGPKTSAPKITKNPASAPPVDKNKAKETKLSKPKKVIQKEESPPQPKPENDSISEINLEKRSHASPLEEKPKPKATEKTSPPKKSELKKKKVKDKKEKNKKTMREMKKKDKFRDSKRKEKNDQKKDDKPKKTKPKNINKAHVDLEEQANASKKVDQILDSLIEGEEGIDAENISSEVTASELDAIKQTLYRCWHVPGGIRGAANMTVPVEIWVTPEGSISGYKVYAKGTSPEMTAAIKSAERAVSDPKCQPLPIPKEKYEKFKNMIIDFNPKNMF